MGNLEEELEKLNESQVNEQQSAVLAVKELTSEKREKEDTTLTNMDFKTRLSLPEVCAHGCLEWINEVITNRESFTDGLAIVGLTKRMKRIRVSEEGKAREGVEQIFKNREAEDQRNWFQRFTGVGNSPQR